MGTSRSGAELARKLNGLAKDMGNVRVPLEVTALHVKILFQGSAASAGALGKAPAGKRKPIGARYDFNNRKSKGLAEGSVVITYTGPAHLLNNPTAPHFIGARRLGSRRRQQRISRRVGATAAFGGSNSGAFGALLPAERITRSGAVRSGGKRALTIGSNLRAYAFHPGTRGKGFFQRAKAAAEATAPGVYARAGLTEPLRRNF